MSCACAMTNPRKKNSTTNITNQRFANLMKVFNVVVVDDDYDVVQFDALGHSNTQHDASMLRELIYT